MNVGETSDVSNFRPITIRPVLSKVFKRGLSDRLHGYVVQNSLFPPSQFGFQKGKCTEVAIIGITNRTYPLLNEKIGTINIFIDHQKAFDTVNHKILLKKLETYGSRGVALEILHSYLRNRILSVRVGDEFP